MEQNKLRNGSQGLKEELEKLKAELRAKSEKLQNLKSEQDKLEQMYSTTALAAATGGSVDDKRRYIGALQMAKGKKQSNLTALQQSVSNYDVSYRRLFCDLISFDRALVGPAGPSGKR